MANTKVRLYEPLRPSTSLIFTIQPDKNAMARALGAAFLNHQVQELEKSVSAKPRFDGSRGRDRRGSRGGQRPQQPSRGGGRPRTDEPRGEFGRRSNEREHSSERDDKEDRTQTNKKDAEVVVVDASVLVHALGQLKTWFRNGREEVIVVPLEGTHMLALYFAHVLMLYQLTLNSSQYP